MPAIYISTNVKVEGLYLDLLFKAAAFSLSFILDRSSDLVMIVVNGSVEMSFGGSKDAATFAELYSMGGIDKALVMIVVNGSVEMSFRGSKDAAAFAELYSMVGIDKAVKRKLISTMVSLLGSHLSIPPTHFFCNVTDVSLLRPKL